MLSLYELGMHLYGLLQLLRLGPTQQVLVQRLQPTTTSPPPIIGKRGLVESHRSGMECLDYNFANHQKNNTFSFTYNWGPELECSSIPGPDPTTGHLGFIPMIWGKHSLNRTIETPAAALLGFNEPNHRKQANMSPVEAALYWPRVVEIAQQHTIPLIGSPAAAPCHRKGYCNGGDALEWSQAFFEACDKSYSDGCRVDFIATHYYGCRAQHLIDYLTKLYQAYGKPIWVTEFNCGGGTHENSVQRQIHWMKTAVPILEALPFVHQYSWMSGRNGHLAAATLFQGKEGNISLTELGKIYVSL